VFIAVASTAITALALSTYRSKQQIQSAHPQPQPQPQPQQTQSQQQQRLQLQSLNRPDSPSSSSPSQHHPLLITPQNILTNTHRILDAIEEFGLPIYPFKNVSIHPTLLVNETYLTAYNFQRRVADFTIELLECSQPYSNSQSIANSNSNSNSNSDLPNNSSKAQRSHSQFRSDPRISSQFSVSPSALLNTSYDRGHLAPAANSRHSQNGMNETFFMSNIIPQHSGLNRQYWSSFEAYARHLSKKYDQVFIITGSLLLPSNVRVVDTDSNNQLLNSDLNRDSNEISPLSSPESPRRTSFLPQSIFSYPVLSPNGSPPVCAVPTHLYKIILARSFTSKDLLIGSFVLPNEHVENDRPLVTFQKPLEEIEYYAGYLFFPRLREQIARIESGNRSLDGLSYSSRKIQSKANSGLLQIEQLFGKSESHSSAHQSLPSSFSIQSLCSVEKCHLIPYSERIAKYRSNRTQSLPQSNTSDIENFSSDSE